MNARAGGESQASRAGRSQRPHLRSAYFPWRTTQRLPHGLGQGPKQTKCCFLSSSLTSAPLGQMLTLRHTQNASLHAPKCHKHFAHPYRPCRHSSLEAHIEHKRGKAGYLGATNRYLIGPGTLSVPLSEHLSQPETRVDTWGGGFLHNQAHSSDTRSAGLKAAVACSKGEGGLPFASQAESCLLPFKRSVEVHAVSEV